MYMKLRFDATNLRKISENIEKLKKFRRKLLEASSGAISCGRVDDTIHSSMLTLGNNLIIERRMPHHRGRVNLHSKVGLSKSCLIKNWVTTRSTKKSAVTEWTSAT